MRDLIELLIAPMILLRNPLWGSEKMSTRVYKISLKDDAVPYSTLPRESQDFYKT